MPPEKVLVLIVLGNCWCGRLSVRLNQTQRASVPGASIATTGSGGKRPGSSGLLRSASAELCFLLTKDLHGCRLNRKLSPGRDGQNRLEPAINSRVANKAQFSRTGCESPTCSGPSSALAAQQTCTISAGRMPTTPVVTSVVLVFSRSQQGWVMCSQSFVEARKERKKRRTRRG
jgi:hypothetical protein